MQSEDPRRDIAGQRTGVSPPRRLWLLGVVGALVAGGIGWTLYRRTAKRTTAVATPGIPQLLDFGMDICEQCKKTRALLTRLEPEYAGKIQVRYIDVRNDENEALVEKYRMRVIPLLVLVDREGAEVWRHEGAPSEAILREQLSQTLLKASAPRMSANAAGTGSCAQ